MPKLVVEGYLEVPPDRVDAVVAALPEHIRRTRAEPGCLRFDVSQSEDRPTRFLVAEAFIDRGAFEAHQARSATSRWAKVTAGMARHYILRTEG